MNKPVAVYTGMFDPVHFGHLDVIRRGSRLFDRFIVGVGINPEKQAFFSLEERVALVKLVVADLPNVAVQPFTGLAVRFVRQCGADVMFRGLRTVSDMEYEFSMSLTNRNLDSDIETIFLMAHEEVSHISSTLIRQIATFGGALDKFVPPAIKDALIRRIEDRAK